MKVTLIILGGIVGLLFLLVITSTIGLAVFRGQARQEAEDLLSSTSKEAGAVVIESDLDGLPEPVQKYLRYTGIVGKERIRSVRLKMKGRFRMKPEQGWFPMTAEEYYTVDPPSLVWFGKVNTFPLFSVTATDKYALGKGRMHVKLLSLFTVADAKGADMDEGAMIRYLNESIWHPTTFLADYISWEHIDSRSARVIMTDQGLSASATCHFNEKGELVDFTADRIYAGTETKEEWHTPLVEYREFNGVRIPYRGGALWKLGQGDFHYIDVEITEIDYNSGSTY
jgi:hypothetical protein